MQDSGKGCSDITVRLDRVVFTSTGWLTAAVDALSGFQTVSDHALKNMDAAPFTRPYGRVRRMTSEGTKTQLFVEYKPRYRRLAPIRVGVVPDDGPGLRRKELEKILHAFRSHRLVVVELAVDFAGGKVNAAFVRRHARFGKCRLRPNRKFPNAAWLGAPGSAAFLRAYPKPSIRGFRAEAQFNLAALIKYGILSTAEFPRLAAILTRKLGFFVVDWLRLSAYIRRHLRHAEDILRRARAMEGNLNQLLRFLRQVTVTNPQRFLVPMPVNRRIAQALERWSREWANQGRMSRRK